MSTREIAGFILDTLTEKQLQAFITLFGNSENRIDESEHDELDEELIADI